MATVLPFRTSPQPFSISLARDTLEPEEFRTRLRKHLQDHPNLTLQQVATVLGLTRQRVSQFVGPLGRPSCAQPNRPAPKRDQAKQKLLELELRVQAGESASAAAKDLGLSINQVRSLGFRTKDLRPTHGKGRQDCNCWRCRRSSGSILPRGSQIDPVRYVQILDLIAWVDPDDTSHTLTHAEISQLSGASRAVVSRIARLES